MIPGRLLCDPPLAGATNMARDAALLVHRACPSLRFYRWCKPTLSLGYFQSADELPLDEVMARGGEVVRRSTGGKAILHEHELTYSLCCPETGALSGGPAREMRLIHEALTSYLSELTESEVTLSENQTLLSDVAGSAWCFEDSSPLDLVLGKRKLLGSAARRQHGWVLFHGSLIIEQPLETPDIAATQREADPVLMSKALGQALGIDFQPGEWFKEELAIAERIELTRYASSDFTLRR
jgi:lipoate-protein ligase A